MIWTVSLEWCFDFCRVFWCFCFGLMNMLFKIVWMGANNSQVNTIFCASTSMDIRRSPRWLKRFWASTSLLSKMCRPPQFGTLNGSSSVDLSVLHTASWILLSMSLRWCCGACCLLFVCWFVDGLVGWLASWLLVVGSAGGCCRGVSGSLDIELDVRESVAIVLNGYSIKPGLFLPSCWDRVQAYVCFTIRCERKPRRHRSTMAMWLNDSRKFQPKEATRSKHLAGMLELHHSNQANAAWTNLVTDVWWHVVTDNGWQRWPVSEADVISNFCVEQSPESSTQFNSLNIRTSYGFPLFLSWRYTFQSAPNKFKMRWLVLALLPCPGFDCNHWASRLSLKCDGSLVVGEIVEQQTLVVWGCPDRTSQNVSISDSTIANMHI